MEKVELQLFWDQCRRENAAQVRERFFLVSSSGAAGWATMEEMLLWEDKHLSR